MAIRIIGLILLILGLSAAALADEPLGIALEGYSYPFPVHFFSFTVDTGGGRIFNRDLPVRMAYMDVAPTRIANGRTAILLHGKNFPGSYWKDTAEILASHGYRVIIVDQIGFLNKSSKPVVPYSFDRLAANTAHLLDSLKIEKVDVVAHSTGGMLGVRFALKYPSRVTHLVLEDPLGLEDYRSKIPRQPVEKLWAAEMNQTEEGYRASVRHYFVQWKPEYEIYVQLRMRMTGSGDFPQWAQTSALIYEMIYDQPVCPEFPRLTVPTLIVVGAQDRTCPLGNYATPANRATLGQFPALARNAARAMQHATALVVQKCGHIPHIEQRAIFHEALIKFLER